MGTIYRKTYTKPIPADAVLALDKDGNRVARWRKGTRTVTAKLTTGKDGADLVLVESRTWTAKLRDGTGIVREVATGCADKTAAQSKLAELERRADRQRAGVLTRIEIQAEGHATTPVKGHITEWTAALGGKGRTAKHAQDMRHKMTRVADECGFVRLADLDRNTLERWLADRFENDNMPARTMNGYAGAAISFGNWLVRQSRLVANPFVRIEKRNEQADRRHVRRAMTSAELALFLDAAERRPVLELLTIRRGKDKGKQTADVRPEILDRARAIGRERALFWRVLAYTGLRFNEARHLRVADLVDLDGKQPRLVLRAESEKNRQGATLPLRRDLADMLAAHLAELLECAGTVDDVPGVVRFNKPKALPPDTPVFPNAPSNVRRFNADLALAEICKKDDRGRVLDIHSLRGTFASLLAGNGVPLATAQVLMRHSTPTLTAKHYIDPRALDLSGAVGGLPVMSTEDAVKTRQEPHESTEDAPEQAEQ